MYFVFEKVFSQIRCVVVASFAFCTANVSCASSFEKRNRARDCFQLATAAIAMYVSSLTHDITCSRSISSSNSDVLRYQNLAPVDDI